MGNGRKNLKDLRFKRWYIVYKLNQRALNNILLHKFNAKINIIILGVYRNRLSRH